MSSEFLCATSVFFVSLWLMEGEMQQPQSHREHRGCTQKTEGLFRRADDANELREFGWSEADVVFRVEEQTVAVELEGQRGVIRGFRENDLDGEGVVRAPCSAGSYQRIGRNTEGAIESVSEHAATVGPGVSFNRRAGFAGGSSHDECRRG